ncbi:MAG: dienelactone hydrolase family protein [Clostridia bacterium]|nr:dienelactone hydrolase family protein [Clostridia bacterium]
MKKFFAIVLVVLLTLTFVGCGKKSDLPTTTQVQNFYSDQTSGGVPYSEYNETAYNGESYVENSTVNFSEQSSTAVSVTIAESNNASNAVTEVNKPQGGSSENNKPQKDNPTQNNSIQNSDAHNDVVQENTTAAHSSGFTPVIENLNGVQKATYQTSERTYLVYYPSELLNKNVQYPLLSWANGTACPPSFYDALLQELARSGFVVVASNETMAADGTAQIAAIDFVLDENINNGSILYKKIDSTKIGVLGHSQGGRSSVNAGAADSRVVCVLSIAGSNYVEEAQKLSKPVLFLAGSKDMVVDPQQWIVTAYNAVTGPAAYASLNGAIHTTCCSNPGAYVNYATTWFNAWFFNNGNLKAVFANGGDLSQNPNWSDFMCKGI